jgi:hypothetical protein
MFKNLPENYLSSGVAASHVAALIAKYSTASAYKGKVAFNCQYKPQIAQIASAN